MNLSHTHNNLGNDRVAFIDLAKGFCISIVILFHLRGILGREYPLDPLLFSACMLPPFFFLSGLLFRDGQSARSFLVRKINRLLIPFLFFYLTTSVLLPNLLHHFWGISFNTVLGWPSLWAFICPGAYPNIPLWFLWCLFLANLLFWIIRTLSLSLSSTFSPWVTVLLCLVCAALGLWAEGKWHQDVASLCQTLQVMPFLCAGYLMKRYNGLQRLSNMSSTQKIICALLALAASMLCCVPMHHLSGLTAALLYYFCGITGALFILTLSAILNRLPLISYLGRYSIIILLTHGLLVRLCTPLVKEYASFVGPDAAILTTWLLFLLVYLLIIPVTRLLLPHFTAQKPLLKEE